MKIDVTLKDILFGKRRTGLSCPITLAVKRALPDTPIVTGVDEIDVYNKSFPLPKRAIEFINAFDNKQFFNPAIFPFSLELNLPEESK